MASLALHETGINPGAPAAAPRRRINLSGVVQGVGFRPFVWNLAVRHGLKGWVKNTSAGVILEVEGQAIDAFAQALIDEAPPLARIEKIGITDLAGKGFTAFEILPSSEDNTNFQLVAPDIATCPKCLKEIFDPQNRRYRYPFTNCTNCGPRFTIIRDLPYDRLRTTMGGFVMCPSCLEEYQDPSDRRFHAQPNACPACGPALVLSDDRGGTVACADPISAAAVLLKEGKIIAIKGLGGFLLAANAEDGEAVALLRKRKARPDKPFAVMVADLKEVPRYCLGTPEEADLLRTPEAPIVLMSWRKDSTIHPWVAPGQRYLGVMLPYTPLHHLLLKDAGIPLLMTSGNRSEEPIARDNEEALRRLGGIADFFLLHNREVAIQYDDSVAAVVNGQRTIVRRARGYAPHPISLPFEGRSILACGGELKNTFCLTRGRYAFLSQHVGDLENWETLSHFEATIEAYKRHFRFEAEIIAYDLHPEYLASKYALARPEGLKYGVQHHHAHLAGCLAENGEMDEVTGLIFDGLGYGLDGGLWGGEFLVGSLRSFIRAAHFEYLPLPGGAAAIRNPWRTAAGFVYALLGQDALGPGFPLTAGMDPEKLEIICRQVDRRINSPLTSSLGRLFDAVAALLGLCKTVSYEGQAAIALEMIADEDTKETYPYGIREVDGKWLILLAPLFQELLGDIEGNIPPGKIAGKFHQTIVEIGVDICSLIRARGGPRKVALSGGVFQNRLLLHRLREALDEAGFQVLTHRLVPCNDGGLALGQAAVAHFGQEPPVGKGFDLNIS